MAKSTLPRIAVVVVHGMGEQRPMDTLREFVDGVKWQLEKNDQAEAAAKVRSKPDSVGDIYETVRLSMESCFPTRRPITDFYEFYWAHNMRGTKFSHMGTWLTQVIFRRVGKVPEQLKKVWWTVWGIFVLAALLSFAFTFLWDMKLLAKAITSLISASVISLAWTTISSFIKTSFFNSLGDVARYLTPEPDNITERSRIRQQGISFLKKLHEINNRTKPGRIIVVAHSLGTVVAYDLLRLLWTEHNNICNQAPVGGQPMLTSVNNYAVNRGAINQANISLFKKAQYDCWTEFNNLGNSWLITDFITLGAALNAIDYFMVNKVPVDQLIQQRELPVCPPEIDQVTQTIYYRDFVPQPGGNRRRGIDILHHGALFAVTRWTNIFFTSDFVGGKMQRIFGKGVEDIAIPRKSPWFYPGGHTDYWSKEKQNALKEIVDALKLS